MQGAALREAGARPAWAKLGDDARAQRATGVARGHGRGSEQETSLVTEGWSL